MNQFDVNDIWIDTNGVTEEDLPEYGECPKCLVKHSSSEWEGLCEHCFSLLNSPVVEHIGDNPKYLSM
jgi:hypothetical protein